MATLYIHHIQSILIQIRCEHSLWASVEVCYVYITLINSLYVDTVPPTEFLSYCYILYLTGGIPDIIMAFGTAYSLLCCLQVMCVHWLHLVYTVLKKSSRTHYYTTQPTIPSTIMNSARATVATRCITSSWSWTPYHANTSLSLSL